jgi:putative transposase
LQSGADGLPDENRLAVRITGWPAADHILKMLRDEGGQRHWAVVTRVKRNKVGESASVDGGPRPTCAREPHSGQRRWRSEHPVDIFRHPEPRLSRWDRIFWVWLSRLWAGWRTTLVIVRPATVLAWHRRGFQRYWRWKSRPNPVGRPRLDAELRTLIRRMARENPTWGRRRIQAELALLGYEVAQLTVAKYMHRTSPRPSPTWRVFLTAHARDIVAVDFFLVPTLTFRLLFVFVVLRHDRREFLHINVTDHPSAVWTAQQIIEAFPDDSAPRFLLRDRDAIYGEEFARRVRRMGIREVRIAHTRPGRIRLSSG